MADDIYDADVLATGTSTVTLTDEGSGIDTIRVLGLYGQTVEITLAWTTDSGVPTSAECLYFNPTGTGHRLVVNGVIENAIGSNGNDFIQGNSIANLIYGDAQAAGAGLDDTLWASAGDDTVYGGNGNDQMLGDDGNDRLYGDDGSDTMTGGAGADTLEGGLGADNLTGGSGVGDTVSYQSSSAGVSIDITFGSFTTGHGGDAESDTIGGFYNVIGSTHEDILIDTVSGQVAFGGNDNQFQGGAGNDQLTLGGGADFGYGGGDNDTLDGGGQNDQLFGGTGRDSLIGGLDDDTLDGGVGADTMLGGMGDDIYFCDANTDIIVEALNEGHDLVMSGVNWTLQSTLEDLTLTGSATIGAGNSFANLITGNDLGNQLSGASGDDTIYGGTGADTLYGGFGDDVLFGGGGNFDVFYGGEGGDTYRFFTAAGSISESGTTGRDKVVSSVNWTLGSTIEDLTLADGATNGIGNFQANQLTGTALANSLSGVSGNDTLLGLGGNDTLSGGADDDFLTGGRGVDRQTGGTGADRFIFTALADLTKGAGPYDTITDFHTVEGDKIDLSQIDAKSGAGNQAFHSIGSAAFSGVKGELRIITSGADFLVRGDTNGDKTADFTLLVQGAGALVGTDFIL